MGNTWRSKTADLPATESNRWIDHATLNSTGQNDEELTPRADTDDCMWQDMKKKQTSKLAILGLRAIRSLDDLRLSKDVLSVEYQNEKWWDLASFNTLLEILYTLSPPTEQLLPTIEQVLQAVRVLDVQQQRLSEIIACQTPDSAALELQILQKMFDLDTLNSNSVFNYWELAAEINSDIEQLQMVDAESAWLDEQIDLVDNEMCYQLLAKEQEECDLIDSLDGLDAEEYDLIASLKDQLDAEESARLDAEESARLNAKESARLDAEESARLNAKESAKLNAEESARLNAEESAKLDVEEGARLNAEENDLIIDKLSTEESARLDVEESTRLYAEEVDPLDSLIIDMLIAEENVRLDVEESARIYAEEVDLYKGLIIDELDAEESVRLDAEESGRHYAEEYDLPYDGLIMDTLDVEESGKHYTEKYDLPNSQIIDTFDEEEYNPVDYI